jgi:hypothetical protein
MSDEELKSELERLRNENAALKKGSPTGIRMKVSEKGAVSIYGMGRFPVTLYKEQWLKLLDMSEDIRRRRTKDGLCWANKKSNVASVFFGALKTHHNFIGNSPLEVATPQRFTVEG